MKALARAGLTLAAAAAQGTAMAERRAGARAGRRRLVQGAARTLLVPAVLVLLVAMLMPGAWRATLAELAQVRATEDAFWSAVVHFSSFFLPWACMRPANLPWPRRPWQILLAGLCMAVATELLQYLSAHREPTLEDVAVNSLGVVIGTFLGVVVHRQASRK